MTGISLSPSNTKEIADWIEEKVRYGWRQHDLPFLKEKSKAELRRIQRNVRRELHLNRGHKNWRILYYAIGNGLFFSVPLPD